MAFIVYFCIRILLNNVFGRVSKSTKEVIMVNKKNPYAVKATQSGKKKISGKRIGKSKPDKANNQLNRRVK